MNNLETKDGKKGVIVFTETDNVKKIKRLKHHFKRMREFAAQWRGREVESRKTGLMFSFQSATDAVSWALDVQNRIGSGNLTLPADERIQHRIGIYKKEKDFISAALQSVADAGEICISQSVYDDVKKNMYIQADILGEYEKNFVYQILVNPPQLEKEIPEEGESRACEKTKWIIRVIIFIIICEFIFLAAWAHSRKIFLSSQSIPVAAPSQP